MNPIIEKLGEKRFAEMFAPYIYECYTDTEAEITLENIQNGYRKLPICFAPIIKGLILEIKAMLDAAKTVKEICE